MKEGTVLSLKIKDVEVKAILPYSDVDLNELFDLFKGLLVAHTFTEEQIDKFLNNSDS